MSNPARIPTLPRAVLGGLVTLSAILCALICAGAFEKPARLAAGEPVYLVLMALAVTLTLAGGICRRERGFILIGIGALMVLGEFCYYVLAGSVSSPSPGDAIELGSYIPMFAGVIALSRRYVAKADKRLWLDGLIVALGVVCVALLCAVPAILHSGESVPQLAVNLAYPLGDMMLLGAVLASLTAARGHAARTWLVLAAGILVFTVTDTVYLLVVAAHTYHNGDPVDAGWLATMVLFACAAWAPAAVAPVARHDGQSRLAILPAAALIPFAALAVRDAHLSDLPGILIGALALVGVLVRLELTHRDARAALKAVTAQSLTDPLSQLGNRQRLLNDLHEAFAGAQRRVLVLFDLDGFKTYNDSFGHVAGDTLLRELAASLKERAGALGASVYRMGGDEFCALSDGEDERPEVLVARLRAALEAGGEGFHVAASAGHAVLGEEAQSASDALRLADQRMYSEKRSGSPAAGQQAKDVLVSAISERDGELCEHSSGVAGLVSATCRQLGLSEKEAERVTLAAELHDVGKVAIPDAVLSKTGPLSESDWQFMRQHTVIGQRIVERAAALRAIGPLVRSAHERWDGTGYPDGLAGDQIPLGAQIIFVCDAYDAMTSTRCYSAALPASAALCEIRRCAGSQFSPRVVQAFCAVHDSLERADRAGERSQSKPELTA